MSIIPQVADSMQEVLIDSANIAGQETGFIQRQRKLTGSLFVQTLVFSWLANPEATYSEMSQTAATIGLDIAPQSIEERFSEKASDTLKVTLDAAVEQMIATEPTAINVLNRFNGVYLHDSSSLQLPNDLADCFAGCGGRTEESSLAAAKLHLRWNIVNGEIDHLSLTDGRTNDKSATIALNQLPPGSIRVADLGYFALSALKQFSDDDVFWLTKYQANTAIFDAYGNRIDLPKWLEKQPLCEFECPVFIGVRAKLSCRLVVQRVSASEAKRRRAELRKQAKAKGRTPSQTRLSLAGYNICLTNVPQSLLCVAEAFVLYRVRWQIELLFKLFKSEGAIDNWRSQKKWRILCEIYGKLIALLIQHWLLLCSGVVYMYHSLTKAAKAVAKHALGIAAAMAQSSETLISTLETISPTLIAGSRIYKRKNRKSTYQSLVDTVNSSPFFS